MSKPAPNASARPARPRALSHRQLAGATGGGTTRARDDIFGDQGNDWLVGGTGRD